MPFSIFVFSFEFCTLQELLVVLGDASLGRVVAERLDRVFGELSHKLLAFSAEIEDPHRTVSIVCM